MKIELTRDTKLIARIMQHPDLFDRITDDAGTSLYGDKLLEHLNKKKNATIYFKVTSSGDNVVGVIECNEVDRETLDFHPNFLKKGRGKYAWWAVKKVIRILFSSGACTRLVCRIPSKYLDVLEVASKMGFKLDYMVEKEYIKNGVEYDMYYMTMNGST
jgi:hypothetical protein